MNGHPNGCMCTMCKADRQANRDAIASLKAEGKWWEPDDVIEGVLGPERVGGQHAMLLNLAQLRARTRRVH